jgi:hypothetical protein
MCRAADAVSVCDIMHPNKAISEGVVVESRILFTMHGTFLTTDACADHSYDIVILYPGVEGTPQVAFKLAPETTERLGPFFRPSGGSAVACGLLNGQVFYKKHFRSKIFGAGPVGNGFGPRGAFRVAFVLQSVSEIRDCK